MPSKRKKKKQQKRAMEQASATAIGNQPNTSMADAMKKADEKKKDSKPAKTKPKPKSSDGSKSANPKPKTIMGFGNKPKSTTIHCVTDLNNSALCDKRVQDIAINDDYTAKDVNCTSCKRYATYRQLLATTTGHEPAEKAVAKAESVSKDVKKKNGAAKKKSKPKPKVTEEQKQKAEESTEMHVLKQLMYGQLKRMEKRLMQNLTEKIEEILAERPEFFIIQSSVDQWAIVHDKSRLLICNGLTMKQAEKLLPLYLDIPYKWDGQSKMPQEWMTAVKKVFDDLKSKPRRLKRRKTKKEKKEKPVKRVLKRRKEPRKIKRRSRH